MLFATGLGRCGMSLLGQCLGAMNYKCGKDVVDYMPKSIHDVNREMYHLILKHGSVDLKAKSQLDYWEGKDFKTILQTFNKDKRQGPIHFVIDPCFMWSPEIVKAWWKARRGIKFIILHRNFDDIIKSAEKIPPPKLRNRGFKSTTPYKEDFADFITALIKMNIPYRINMFPSLMHDAKPLFKNIRELGLLQTCHIEGHKMMTECRDI